MFEIKLLGSFALYEGGEPIPINEWGSRVTRELLKYLATDYNNVVSDDDILESLWPNYDRERSRRILWVRISELRNLLGRSGRDPSTIIKRVAGGYSLITSPGHVEVDVEHFTEMVRSTLDSDNCEIIVRSGEKVRTLYRGDFLVDDQYNERWYLFRERFLRMFRESSVRMVGCLEDEGQYDAAIDIVRSIISPTEPHEGHYALLMRLYYLSGKQTEALRTYEQCHRALDQIYGVRPMPQTLRLLESIIQRKPVVDSPGRVSLQRAPGQQSARKFKAISPTTQMIPKYPFLGRQKEMSLLQAAMFRLQRGTGAKVWIDGPSGSGKSRLISETLDRFETHRIYKQPIFIRGNTISKALPFSVMIDGLRECFGDLAVDGLLRAVLSDEKKNTLAPHENKAGDVPINIVAGETLYGTKIRQTLIAFIEGRAKERPLVFVIDNPNHIDQETLELLVTTARRIPAVPILYLIAAHDRIEIHEFGRALMELPSPVQCVSLRPLSLNDFIALLNPASITPTSREWLSHLHQQSGGDPYTLTELLHGMEHSGTISRSGGGTIQFSPLVMPSRMLASPPRFKLTQDIRHETDGRISYLSRAARMLVIRAAAFGEVLSVERLNRLSRMTDDEFLASFEELLAGGFLTWMTPSGRETIRFSHARLQSYIYYQSTDAHRKWLHNQISEIIEEDIGYSPFELELPFPSEIAKLTIEAAYHARLSGDYEKACEWLFITAENATLRFGSTQSVELYRQALDIANMLPSNKKWLNKIRGRLMTGLYEAQLFEEVIPLLERELTNRKLDSAEAFMLTSRLAFAYMQFNQTENAQKLLKQLSRQANAVDDLGLKSKALLYTSFISYRIGDVFNAIKQMNIAIKYLSVKDPGNGHLALAYRWLSLYHWDVSQYGLAIKYARFAVSHYRSCDNRLELIRALNQLGEIYQDLFCIDSAQLIHREAFRLAIKSKHSLLISELWRNTGMNFLYGGKMDKGLSLLERSWWLMVDLGAPPYQKEMCLRSLIEAYLLKGNAERVTELLRDYERFAGPREQPFTTIFKTALSMLEENWDAFATTSSQMEDFWKSTNRLARKHHVLLFLGRSFIASGAIERGKTVLLEAIEHLEHVSSELPDDLKEECFSSQQLEVAREILSCLDETIDQNHASTGNV